MNRPEHVTCAMKNPPDQTSWCGRVPHREFVFQDATHAMSATGSRLQLCPQCAEAMHDALRAVTFPPASGTPDAGAEKMLEQLSKHYRQPVLPLNRFCDAITTWMRAIEQNNTEEEARREHPLGRWRPEDQHGHSYWQHLGKIKTDIRKSGLLYRLLFKGEKLRTRRCPVHRGHQMLGPSKEACPHGCGFTGWLPEEPAGVNKGS